MLISNPECMLMKSECAKECFIIPLLYHFIKFGHLQCTFTLIITDFSYLMQQRILHSDSCKRTEETGLLQEADGELPGFLHHLPPNRKSIHF